MNSKISIKDFTSRPKALQRILTNDTANNFITIDEGVQEYQSFTNNFLESVDDYLYNPQPQAYNSYRKGTDATESYKNFVFRSDISEKIRSKQQISNYYTLDVCQLTAEGKAITLDHDAQKKSLSLIKQQNKVILKTNEETEHKRKDIAFMHRKFASNPDRDRMDLFMCNNYVGDV